VSGLLSGDIHLTGDYERPVGFGSMTLDGGVAYGEPFEKGDGGAAVRRQRRAARLGVAGKEQQCDHRRRVRRLGFHVLLRRHRAGVCRSIA